jgi:hypothetical protein
MTVPAITTITPANGPSGGGNLVEIVGTGFREYTSPSSGFPGGAVPATVKVLFGGEAAAAVYVQSATHLSVEAPPYTGDSNLEVFAAVDLIVSNLDDAGVVISGETFTQALAYSYAREPMRQPTVGDITSPFERVSRRILRLLKAQVVRDAGPPAQDDYSQDGLRIKTVGPEPSLTLLGPSVGPNHYMERGPRYWEVQTSGPYVGSAVRHCQHVRQTLEYVLEGDAGRKLEGIALGTAVRQFFQRNKYLVLPGDVPQGMDCRMPMKPTGNVDIQPIVGGDGLTTVRVPFAVTDVPVLYLPPDMRTWAVSTILLGTQTTTGTLVEVKTL